MTQKILFVGGIHGVGKSTLCDSISSKINAVHHSASELISRLGKVNHSTNKQVTDINKNQDVLIAAVNEYLSQGTYLLDGHFCLLNKSGEITEVPISTFDALSPVAIMVLIDEPENIITRLNSRDKEKYDLNLLSAFQERELAHSQFVSRNLDIPYFKANPFSDADRLLKFAERYL